MKKLFFAALVAVALCGCNTIKEIYRVDQAEIKNRLGLGMSYDEVVKIVGRGPDQKRDVIREEEAKEGTYKTWILHGNSNFAPPYSFTFLNDKLLLWGEE